MDFTIKPKNQKNTITLVAALVAVLVMIQMMPSKKKRRGGAAPSTVAAAGLVVPLAGGMAAQTWPAGYVPAPGDTAFGGDPFLGIPEAVVSSVNESSGEPDSPGVPRFKLQGTIVSEGRSMALISGRYYAPGQEIEGWRLAWVSPGEARLVRDGETLTLRVGRD